MVTIWEDMTIREVRALINNRSIPHNGDTMWGIKRVLDELNKAWSERNPRGDARSDADTFMMFFYCAYLNLNRLTQKAAYDIACQQAAERHITPLTMAQVRGRLAKVDKKTVLLARYGEEAFNAAGGKVTR